MTSELQKYFQGLHAGLDYKLFTPSSSSVSLVFIKINAQLQKTYSAFDLDGFLNALRMFHHQLDILLGNTWIKDLGYLAI